MTLSNERDLEEILEWSKYPSWVIATSVEL